MFSRYSWTPKPPYLLSQEQTFAARSCGCFYLWIMLLIYVWCVAWWSIHILTILFYSIRTWCEGRVSVSRCKLGSLSCVRGQSCRLPLRGCLLWGMQMLVLPNCYWKLFILFPNNTQKHYVSILKYSSKIKVPQFYVVTMNVCTQATANII